MWWGPAGVVSPTLESVSSSSVLVTWSTPRQPNGRITQYVIQRRQVSDNVVSDAVTVVLLHVDDFVAQTHEYMDESPSLRPHTEYQYNVAAQTSAGLTTDHTLTTHWPVLDWRTVHGATSSHVLLVSNSDCCSVSGRATYDITAHYALSTQQTTRTTSSCNASQLRASLVHVNR